MKLGGNNKNKSKIRDWHNRIGSALFSGVGGGDNSEKLEKWGICNLRTGNQIFIEICLILSSDQILWHWGELEGDTRILGKRENRGILILRIDDRILMKFNI